MNIFRVFTFLKSASGSKDTMARAKGMLAKAKSTYHKLQTVQFQETLEKGRHGNPRAQFDLGERYFRGDGVPKDDDEAARWFLQAAHRHHPKAQASVGLMYFLGRGVNQDRIEAAKWLLLAARQGDPAARKTFDKLKKHLTELDLAEAKLRASQLPKKP